ncbi:MAG: CAP domain-containing protein [Actinomycetota bacterium]|nr:CAP domain-containing protein [Actinomycetota bacterium]
MGMEPGEEITWRKAGPRRLVMAVALLCGVVLLVQWTPSAPTTAVARPDGGCPGAWLLPEEGEIGQMKQATLCLVNGERARRGLSVLVEDPALEEAAIEHSIDMARRDYFEHNTPEGVQPWMRIAKTGYRASLVGENLAWGEREKGTAGNALQLWLDSPGHRRNMLDPRYSQIGIGIVFDAPDPNSHGAPAAVFTTTFGSAAYTTE